MQKITNDIKTQIAIPLEKVIANIEKNSNRGLKGIHDLPEWRDMVSIAVVGGGPSLNDTIDTLRRFRYVMACGSVHDHLVRSGVKPTWTVIVDGDPVMAEYIRRPVNGCTYLVASQCDDAVFRALRRHKVILWHASDGEMSREIWGDGQKLLIGGGCTVGLCAIMIALSFGYGDFHLFGFDTCVPDESAHHAYEFATGKETVGELARIRLGSQDGKEFLMAPYHFAQLCGFEKLLEKYANRMKITVHGGGALDEILRLENCKMPSAELS